MAYWFKTAWHQLNKGFNCEFTWDWGVLKSWTGISQFHFIKGQLEGRSWCCLGVQSCYFYGIILSVVKTDVINALEKKSPCQPVLTAELSRWVFCAWNMKVEFLFETKCKFFELAANLVKSVYVMWFKFETDYVRC